MKIPLTFALMPNNPMLTFRENTMKKYILFLFWIFLRGSTRLINSFSIPINVKNRIINHAFFQHNTLIKSSKKDYLWGYAGFLIQKGNIEVNDYLNIKTNFILERPFDFPPFFNKTIEVDDHFYFFASNNPYNYFHFLADCIIPSYGLHRKNNSIKLFLPFACTTWQKNWLSKIPLSELITSKSNGALIAPKITRLNSFLDHDNKIREKNDLTFFRNFVLDNYIENSNYRLYKKIYVKRKNSSMGRNIKNQDEIIHLLEKENFKILDLDLITVEDQINIFYNADIIVAPHDAGLTNIIFARTSCRIIELLPKQSFGLYDMYKNISNELGIDYTPLISPNSSNYNPGSNFVFVTQTLKKYINS